MSASPNRPPLPPAPEVLLLDAGNTLIFLDEEVVSACLGELDIRVAAHAVRDALGPAKKLYERRLTEGLDHEDGWYVHMREVLRVAGVEADRLSAAVAALRASHDQLNLWRRVPEEVPAALDRLRAVGIRLAVVSNSEGSVESVLRYVGLRSRLETVVDSHHEGVCKPDPVIFHRALDRMNASDRDAMYVGDVPAVDIEGARAAGLSAVLVDPFDHYPDYDDAPVVTSVAALADAWCATHS